MLVQDGAGEVAKGQIIYGLRSPSEDMSLYSKRNEKALRGCKQGRRVAGGM